MADENTNISPTGNAPDLSPEAADISPSADTTPSITPADTQPQITRDETGASITPAYTPQTTPAETDASITAADFTPSKTAAEEGGAISKATPAASTDAKKYEELHSEPHPHFRWHVDVLAEGHVYHGIVRDISMKAATLYLEHNLQNAKLVKLHIHVPPLLVTSQPHVMDVSAKILSTIYDGSENSFRSSISFQKFTPESDQAFLHSRLVG